MHKWIPTKEFLHKQHREESPICTRCNLVNENADHILVCEDPIATTERTTILFEALKKLHDCGTPPLILMEFERYLCQALYVKSSLKYTQKDSDKQHHPIKMAVRHQNLIGWDTAIRGYVSSYWITNGMSLHDPSHKRGWETKIVVNLIDMHREIWAKRNEHIHGKTVQEAKIRARAAVIRQVQELYNKKSKLANRYQPIDNIPFKQLIRRTTIQLKGWIARIRHQTKVTEILFASRPPGQLTIQEAFKIMKLTQDHYKYPPQEKELSEWMTVIGFPQLLRTQLWILSLFYFEH
jgi:hypothetical protein